jgi:hypothetical protein
LYFHRLQRMGTRRPRQVSREWGQAALLRARAES